MKSSTRPDYAEVEPLVEEYDIYPPTLYVSFRCPASGTRIQATANVEGHARSDLWAGLKSSAMTALSLMLVGLTGDADKGLKPRARSSAKHDYDKAAVEKALVDAFLTVRGCFRQTPDGWVAREKGPELSGLERQLRDHPIKGPLERDLLTRCLVGIAALDGTTSPSEKKFLQRFAPAFERLPQGMPSLQEFAGIREEARPTVYLLALTLALVDHDYCQPERDYMADLAQGLTLPAPRVDELSRWAGEFLVRQTVKQNPHLTDAEADLLSRLTGISQEQIHAALERYRKSVTS